MMDILDHLNPKVKANVTIVTPKDINQDYLLHIAKMKFNELVPNISKMANVQEDNTVARVHCGPSLVNCILGYERMHWDLINLKPKESIDTVAGGTIYPYKGGYYIYKIPFKMALRPNNKLVYDAKITNEHWLTTYSKDTAIYKANIVGKIFPHKLIITGSKSKKQQRELTVYLEVNKPINIYEENIIEPGTWQLVILDTKPVSYGKITDIEYNANKKLSANTLSYLNW